MNGFCGIDIGSAAVKIVLIDDAGARIGSSVSPSGHRFQRNAADALDRLLKESGIRRREVRRIAATGYGRKLFAGADGTVSEITANAVGAGQMAADDGVRTIINIGGQDSKVIVLDGQGRVKNFAMNDKCAAGTGRFLEMTAMHMGIDLEEMGRGNGSGDTEPAKINSTCSVFAASEIVSLLAEGHGKKEIIAGVHRSIARRIAGLARNCGVEDVVLFDGGGALNEGLQSALEDELGREVQVPCLPQLTTALGAALWARNGGRGMP